MLLTVGLVAHNDDYCTNYKHRLTICLSQLCGAIVGRYEDDVRVVVCDWASDPPLEKALALPGHCRGILKFMHVPPAMARRYADDAKTPAIGLNALARRLTSDWFLHITSDEFIPDASLANILRCIRENSMCGMPMDGSFFWCSRRHIPYELVSQNPSVVAIEDHIRQHEKTYVREAVNTENFMGCACALLVPTDLYRSVGGCEESLLYWGWSDIELHNRLMARQESPLWGDMDLESAHPIRIYHQEHWPNRDLAARTVKQNPQFIPTKIFANGPDWGMANEQLK